MLKERQADDIPQKLTDANYADDLTLTDTSAQVESQLHKLEQSAGNLYMNTNKTVHVL